MNYTNLDSRLKFQQLSPSFLRRLKRIRANSLKGKVKKSSPASAPISGDVAPVAS